MFLGLLIILVCFVSSNVVQSDIDCLRSIKKNLQDPQHLLSSWDFNNSTEGFICRFTGVECWHPDESKVFNIHLSHMGLRGPFPMGFGNCTSLIGLNLSSNHLTGPIPSNLSDVIPFVTSLDLSNNNLSGPIPASLGNCSFLNVLRLNNNHLTGQIPPELGGLNRLKEFSVANNRLIGKVPSFSYYPGSAASFGDNLDSDKFNADSYANNSGRRETRKKEEVTPNQSRILVDLEVHEEEAEVEQEMVEDAVVVEEVVFIIKEMEVMVGLIVKTRVEYSATIVKTMDTMRLSVRIQGVKGIKKTT
nr:probably inactive leucine-rich repeat receptor-like protein kinase At5g48380 [Tanacetum cinerariifolium]